MTLTKISEHLPADMAAFSEVQLTEEEIAAALLEARHKKYAEMRRVAYLKKLRETPTYPKYTAEDVKEQLVAYLTKLKKPDDPAPVLDQFNEAIAWNLCLYFTRDSRCTLDLDKGLALFGPVGCGKSTLVDFFKNNQSNSYIQISTLQIGEEYQKHGHEAIQRYYDVIKTSDLQRTFGQPEIGICFDDVGTEEEKKYFGNQANVMADIILHRYNRLSTLRSKTHMTTNLSTDQLMAKYGDRVRDRLREMFNMIAFDPKSPSRRK